MPDYYQHNGTSFVHVSDYAALETRLAEVIAERDNLRTMLLNERAEWMDEAIRRQASVNENLAALVIDAQEELRKCQQDAIQLQARLVEAEKELSELKRGPYSNASTTYISTADSAPAVHDCGKPLKLGQYGECVWCGYMPDKNYPSDQPEAVVGSMNCPDCKQPIDGHHTLFGCRK